MINEPVATQETRGFDKVSAGMAIVTTVMILWTLWLRFSPSFYPETPAVGSRMPALRLLDPGTREPLVLLGLGGKVVWISIVAGNPEGSSSDGAILSAMEPVWKRFKSRASFAMVVLGADAEHPEPFRKAVAASRVTFPTYLASPETSRAFGADPGVLPLHLLIDPSGLVVAIAHGKEPSALSRLLDKAGRYLDEIEPPGPSRFATLLSKPSPAIRGIKGKDREGKSRRFTQGTRGAIARR